MSAPELREQRWGPRFRDSVDAICLRHNVLGCPSCLAYALGDAQEEAKSLRADVARLTKQKDEAYSERDQCVAALAKMATLLGWPAGVGEHPAADTDWDADWRTIVFIDLPTGQASWHFHDSEKPLLDGLPDYDGPWDGHTTPEKYERLKRLKYASLAALAPAQPPKPEGKWVLDPGRGVANFEPAKPSVTDRMSLSAETFHVDKPSRPVTATRVQPAASACLHTHLNPDGRCALCAMPLEQIVKLAQPSALEAKCQEPCGTVTVIRCHTCGKPVCAECCEESWTDENPETCPKCYSEPAPDVAKELRIQRDDEAWMHAACLSIAEGIQGWRECVDASPAIKAVKALRERMEAAETQRDELKRRVQELTESECCVREEKRAEAAEARIAKAIDALKQPTSLFAHRIEVALAALEGK